MENETGLNDDIFQELDEEEHFTDVIDPEDVENTPSLPPNDVNKQPNAVHVKSFQGHVFVDSPHTSGYLANARNPLYSGADNSCLWEVMKLSRHYHPSVARFAQNLLQVNGVFLSGCCLLIVNFESECESSKVLSLPLASQEYLAYQEKII